MKNLKKRILSVVIAATMLFVSLPLNAVATTEYTVGDFKCMLIDDVMTITAYSGSGPSVYFPYFLGEHKIKAIGENVLLNRTDITEISIAGGISQIGDNAFKGCTNLQTIEIPKGMQEVGNGAFSGCDFFTIYFGCSVDSWSQINFASNDFSHVTLYTIQGLADEIRVSSFVKNLGTYAFSGISSITKVTIDAKYNIGHHAFYNCINLEEVDIGYLPNIGDYAFSKCPILTKVELPGGLQTIGKNAFSDCRDLSEIYIPDNVFTIGKGAFKNANKNFKITAPHHSTAGEYAESNNIPLNCVDCIVKYVKQKNPTCTKTGYSGDSHCIECGKLIEKGKKLDKIDHSYYFKGNVVSEKNCYKKYICIGCNKVKKEYMKNTIETYDFQTKEYKYKTVKVAVKISGIKKKAYTGKRIKQNVKVSENGFSMYEGWDYKVKYKNNKNPGKATVIISFTNYIGTIKKSFIITPQKATLKSLTAPEKKQVKVKWKKDSKATGYQIVYATNSNFTKAKKTENISKSKTTSKTLKNLKSKKTYYVKVRSYIKVDGKKYYGSFSKVKKIKTK